jgi:hypothetical protein
MPQPTATPSLFLFAIRHSPLGKRKSRCTGATLVHRDRFASPGGSEGDARFGPLVIRIGGNPCAGRQRGA